MQIQLKNLMTVYKAVRVVDGKYLSANASNESSLCIEYELNQTIKAKKPTKLFVFQFLSDAKYFVREEIDNASVILKCYTNKNLTGVLPVSKIPYVHRFDKRIFDKYWKNFSTKEGYSDYYRYIPIGTLVTPWVYPYEIVQ